MDITWERTAGQYNYGDTCYAGKVPVGSVYQPSVSRGQTPPWRAGIKLPGITLKEGATDFATKDEAKARVERAVRTWFAWTQEIK